MIPLHRVARTFMVTAKVIEFVAADVYPIGIYMTDNNGMLPFHHALFNFWIWNHYDVFYTLLQLYPDAVANKGLQCFIFFVCELVYKFLRRKNIF